MPGCKSFNLDFSNGPLVMGILNITPDSFSDGGMFLDHKKAVEHALMLEDEGADIIDIGGESSRPYAMPVSEDEETRRVVPLISELDSRLSALISIDTIKSRVAKKAVDAGASIINDISAMTIDADMMQTAARTGAAVILMHMKGEPRIMQINPCYSDPVSEIQKYLESVVLKAEKAGIKKSRIIIDPGIGFGKNVSHNLAIINGIPEFKKIGVPVLVGPSRKSFIQKITGTDIKNGLDEADAGTVAAVAASILNGADIVRVHNVRAAKAAVKIINALKNGYEE